MIRKNSFDAFASESFSREKARRPYSEERVPTVTGGDEWPKWLFL